MFTHEATKGEREKEGYAEIGVHRYIHIYVHADKHTLRSIHIREQIVTYTLSF